MREHCHCLTEYLQKLQTKQNRYKHDVKRKSCKRNRVDMKPVFHLANLFSRTASETRVRPCAKENVFGEQIELS